MAAPLFVMFVTFIPEILGGEVSGVAVVVKFTSWLEVGPLPKTSTDLTIR
jgi:hypothetical protein